MSLGGQTTRKTKKARKGKGEAKIGKPVKTKTDKNVKLDKNAMVAVLKNGFSKSDFAEYYGNRYSYSVVIGWVSSSGA